MHAEKLEYGWWDRKRGNVQLPTTLGSRNNYVLTEEELCHLDMALAEMLKIVEEMRKKVDHTIRVRRSPYRIRPWKPDPTCFTIAHVMQLMVNNAKSKLDLVNLLVYITRQRNPREQPISSPAVPDESPSGPDPR